MSDPAYASNPSLTPLLDWAALLERVESARAELEHGWSPTAEETRDILRARAQALAQEPRGLEAPQAPLTLAQFRLGAETYGIDLSYVREVYPLKDLTPLPGAPRFVMGVINFRGQILSIVDLRHVLELPLQALPEGDKVLIIHNSQLEFGIAVDSVLGVRMVQGSELQPPPALTGAAHGSYLLGVTSDHLIVLSAARLLNDPDLIVNDEENL